MAQGWLITRKRSGAGARVRLSDDTILVAGGTSGIGHALAEQLYLRGNDVVIDRSVRRLRQGAVPDAERGGNIPAISHQEDLASDPHTIARSIIETNIVGGT